MMTEPERVADVMQTDDKIADLRKRADERAAAYAQLSDEEKQRLRDEEEARRRKVILEDGIRRMDPKYRKPIRLHEMVDPHVRQWLNDFWKGKDALGDRHSLVFQGVYGSGKTHTAWEICKALLMKGWDNYRFVDVPTLFKELRPAEGRDERLIDKLINVDLLILDDLGAQKLTEWREKDIIGPIVDRRYVRQAPIIFTTNVGVKKFTDVFGGRVGSRMAEMCRVVTFPPIDFRKQPFAVEEVRHLDDTMHEARGQLRED